VFDIMGRKKWFFAFSLAIMIPGLIFIILTPITGGKVGLQFSIDYTGGTLWEFKFAEQTPTPDQVQAVFVANGLADTTVVDTDGGYLLARTEPVGLRGPESSPEPSAAPSASPATSASPAISASPAASGSAAPSASAGPSASPRESAAVTTAAPGETLAPPSPLPSPSISTVAPTKPTAGPLGDVATALEAQFGPIEATRELTTIGPVISTELTQQAVILILLGSLGIMLWMTFRFRNYKFGVTALLALLHDVIVVVGVFAILGTFFGTQVDGLFITAMLTVIGFSVHDTIVVFDRVRENKARHAGEPIAAIANHSVMQTLGRSINTTMTVVFTLTALLLFAGPSLRNFVLALLIGIISGTYSSIFVASPLLVVWEEWDAKRRAQRAASAKSTRRATA
jgi:preprotein translocase SecF subunit